MLNLQWVGLLGLDRSRISKIMNLSIQHFSQLSLWRQSLWLVHNIISVSDGPNKNDVVQNTICHDSWRKLHALLYSIKPYHFKGSKLNHEVKGNKLKHITHIQPQTCGSTGKALMIEI